MNFISKQITAFGLIILFMIAASVYSITELMTMRQDIENISQNWMAGMTTLGDIRGYVLDHRAVLLHHANSTSPIKMRFFESRIEGINSALDSAIRKFSRRKMNDDERSYFLHFVNKWKYYNLENEQTLELSREGKKAEAIDALMNSGWISYRDVKNDLEEIANINSKYAATAVEDAKTSYERGVQISILLLVLTILVSFAVAVILHKNTAAPIKRLARQAKRIALGEDVELFNSARRDEIGALKRAFDAIIVSNRDIASHAKAIAGGDYNTVITPRSNLDSIALAIQNMTQQLRTNREDHERELYIEKNMGELQALLLGETNFVGLAEKVTYFMSEKLNINFSSVYLHNDTRTQLHLVSNYSRSGLSGKSRFYLGEGAIGRAALEPGIIEIAGLDSTVFLTNDSESKSYNSVLAPISFHRDNIGMMLLANDHPFTDIQREIIGVALSHIGVAVKSALATEKIKNLLEYSQKQSEELQVQQEELLAQKEEIERQAELYKTLANNIPGGDVYIIDKDLRYVLVEGSLFKRHGYSREMMVGQKFTNFIIPEHRDTVERLYSETFNGVADEVELDYQGVFYRLQTVPLRDSSLGVNMVMVLAQDVTELKRVQKQLEDSLQKYQVLFSVFPMGIAVYGKDGQVVESNKRAELLLGADEKAIHTLRAGDRVLKLYDMSGKELQKEDIPAYKMYHERKIVENVEMRAIRGDEEIWLSVTSAPLPLHDYSGLTVFADITDRMKATQKLNESEIALRAKTQELEAILEAIPIPLWIAHDRECHNITGSRRSYEVLRVPYGGIVTKTPEEGVAPPTFTPYSNGVELKGEELPIQLAARTGKPVYDFHEDIVFEDGEVVNLIGNSVPIFDENGEVRGAIGAFMDITELKKKEAELHDVAEKLSEINASKDKFFSIIAHDLKNPFVYLLGTTEFLEFNYEKLPQEKIKENVKEIHTASKQLFGLLDNLLQWSRAQSGRIEYNPQPINLYEIINNNIYLFRKQASAKELSITAEIDPHIFAWADYNMLMVTLRNLISNAVKFTLPGGSIDIACQANETHVEISVADTGVGMREETLEALFRIDKRQSQPGTFEEKGTGLGLILCKEFIEKNGGSISVKSLPGEGSIFTFSLLKANENDEITNI